MKATIEQLANISIFADLKPEQIALLQPDSEIREYQSEETIMQEGDRLPATLYAVAQGRLRVVKTATTGKETILRTLLVTPYFASNHLADLMKLNPEVCPNLKLKHYPGGHMFYTWEASCQQWFAEMQNFYQTAIAE